VAREPEPWPRSFVCSLVRNAYEQAPGAAYVARAVTTAVDLARLEYKRQRKDDLREALRPLARALYGDNDWKWPPAAFDSDDLIRRVTEQLTQLPLAPRMEA
jgi:hypothetical protein